MRLVLAILVSAFVASNLPVCAQAPAPNRPPTVSETESAAMHLRVAMKAVEDGNFQIALDEVIEAAKLSPADAAIQFALATILEKTGKVEEALAALDKAQTIGIPDAYRAKADDLRATLLYKRRKAAEFTPVASPPRLPWPTPTGPYVFIVSVKSDRNGEYEVALPSGTCIIQYSLIGFKTYRYELPKCQAGTVRISRIMEFGSSDDIVIGPSHHIVPISSRGGGLAAGQLEDSRGLLLPSVDITVFVRTSTR